jgi:hypothetical protein
MREMTTSFLAMTTTVTPVWYNGVESVIKQKKLVDRDLQCGSNGEKGIERQCFLYTGSSAYMK